MTEKRVTTEILKVKGTYEEQWQKLNTIRFALAPHCPKDVFVAIFDLRDGYDSKPSLKLEYDDETISLSSREKVPELLKLVRETALRLKILS